MIKKIILCLCLLLLIFNVYAQFNENQFEAYSVLNGLSDNNVTCIAQDASGYMWIGTEMGLNRFDGEEFKHYLNGKEPLYIPGTYIVNIVPCSNQCLGIVTRKGFQLINPKDFTYKSYRFPDTSSFSIYANYLLDGRELADKSVLLGSGTGIYSFDKPGHFNFRYDAFKSQDIGSKKISFVQGMFSFADDDVLIYYYDKGNHLYHYSYINKKLDHIDSTDQKWKEFYPTKWGRNCTKISQNEFILFSEYSDSLTFYNSLLNKKVVSKISCLSSQELNYESRIYKISENNFAITCSRSGYYLLHLDKATGSITCDGIKYLPSYKCNYLFVDNEKRLWAGTRTGLLKQKLTSLFIQSYFLNTEIKNGLSLKLSGICRYKNKIYLGSFNRFKGLLVLDTATMKIEKEITFYGGNNGWSEIGDIQCYHKDTLWVGTTNGLLWLDVKSYHYGVVLDNKGDTVFNSTPFLYPPDKSSKAWVGAYMKGKAGFYNASENKFTFFTSSTKPEIPFTRIKHIVYDSYGDVWIAGHGIARWNNSLQQFDPVTTVYAGPNKFNEDILAITADTKGSLWMYNAENILLEYKIKEKKFYEHDSREGLPEYVQSMANNVNNKLWFTTGNKLVCYDLISKKIFFFDQDDGLPAERASSRSIYFDKERNCFYSLHNNYLAVFPADPPEANSYKKNLLITEIVFSDTTFYNPASDLFLSYEHNNCSVHFTVLDYDAPHDYDFFYRIDNKSWINLERNQVIFFNSLPSGKHHVEIKATGKYGEKYITGIIISIAFPFWKTWWFVLLLFLLVSVVIYLLYRNRVNQLKRLLTVRTKISQDLHDDMGSTLGSISIYSEVAKNRSEKNENVYEAISKIGNASRELIDKMSDIVWSINPKNESFQQLQNRMHVFAAMMLTPREIIFNTYADEALKKIRLSTEARKNIYLIYKEAIHNIIKYAECSAVEIKLLLNAGEFIMIIKDNGKGFDVNAIEQANGSLGNNGIKNMQARAKSIKAFFSIQSIINTGTTIELKLKV